MKNKGLIKASVLLVIACISFYVHGQTLIIDSFISVDEPAGEIALEVRLSGALDSIVTVDYATEDIDAEAGRDYVAQRGTLSFDSGEKSKLIHIIALSVGERSSCTILPTKP